VSQPIYLVVGVPGVGKSWVCEQLTEKFEHVPHDEFIYLKQPGAYLSAILAAAKTAKKPLLCEAPFSISETKEPLERKGHTVIPVFIIEPPAVLSLRYLHREKKQIPQGHLTRMQTYAERAEMWGSFAGTSAEVYEHLKSV
jgi:adenylate kinase family enzyme